VFERPTPGGTHVLDFHPDFLDRLRLGGQAIATALQEGHIVAGIFAVQVLVLIRVAAQFFVGVLADRLVQVIAVARAPSQQGFVHQRGEQQQVCTGQLFRSFPPEPASEDGQAPEGGAFFVGEQLPGMVEGSPQAAMPVGDIPG
jgi:hypothetical protein